MDDIRKVIKKNSPPAVVLQTLRTALTMPPAAARNIIKDLTRPLGDQKRFIRKFNNDQWKGTLIMSEMIRCDDDIAIQRLKKADIVIFEVHGGGFRVGHSTMYMESFISWLRLIKSKYNLYACIMSVEYGLAPMHKYPGPLNDCVKAFDYLTNGLGISPSKIVLSGDSAGGALVIETLIQTYAPAILQDLSAPRENFKQPLPAAALLSSPLVSGVIETESWKLFHKTDVVSMGLSKLIYKEYLGLPETKIEDLPIMRLHHVKNNFDRFMPKNVMVFIGDKEVLRDDVVNMVDAIKKDAKINIQFIKENYAHDWFMIHELVKKKDKHLIAKYDEQFVDFCVDAVEQARKSLVDTAAKPTAKNARKASEDTININETIDVDQLVNEKKPVANTTDIERKITDITKKFDEPFELFEKINFPAAPAIVHKPNTILSEYAIITDRPSKNSVSV
ncbi:alpha/beta hydrolase fold domain containing protein [Mucor ambiguus]|uniref:Alpha/beta hydrolase fold domain containing protein n=1 Tax=Mucor ambiguus TaxID=91626 RepID=A0A0C9MXC3_9FUNG|nr:alpha/beta hydrolase fold domain containing protein [Mucor ambiguus]